MVKRLTFSGPMPYYKGVAYEFNLPAGHTCPGARECLVKADRATGKMANGACQRFRCYAASAERFPGVREARWRNWETIQASKDICGDLCAAIPRRASRIRIHGSGDFFNQKYFDAWLEVARQTPAVQFWAFTKSVPLWVNRLGVVPANLILQASRGGKHDALIDLHGLKSATVFATRALAEASGLPVDTDDTFACSNLGSFALVDNFGPDRGG